MKFKKFKNTFCFLYLFVLTSIYSCSLVEPSSPIASYIHIDTISLTTNYPTQGSNSNKITDAWIIYDNVYLGTFPLPADIPLIGEGNHTVSVKAGIIENGIASTRAAYPKYKAFDTTVVLSSKVKTFLSPKVSYVTGANFPQVEDFDDASLSLVKTTTGSADLLITQQSDPNSFERNSGMATLDENHTIFEYASSSPFALPLSTPTFLELNYKGDNDFTIGVYITMTTGVIKSGMLSVRASSTWKKIYVSMSDLGGVASGGIDYKIYLYAEKNPVLTSANIYFDNLKVVF